MSESLEKLKKIGVQKIHEATHIPRVHVQSILNENFEDMNNIQLLGFLSVLEREYSFDLSVLKNQAKEYFEKNRGLSGIEKSASLFIASKKKRNLTPLYISVVIVIFIAFTFFSLKTDENEAVVDNSAIVNAQNNISVIEDKNLSKNESNITKNEQIIATEQATIQNPIEPLQQKSEAQNPIEPIEEQAVLKEANLSNVQGIKEESKQDIKEEQKQEIKQDIKEEQKQEILPLLKENNESKNGSKEVQKEPLREASFKISSKNKVWIGYIDLKSYKQSQKTFSGEIILDPTKDWLVGLGHGFIDVEINGVVTNFRQTQNVRFSYINSKLKVIDAEEFKSLNRGNLW